MSSDIVAGIVTAIAHSEHLCSVPSEDMSSYQLMFPAHGMYYSAVADTLALSALSQRTSATHSVVPLTSVPVEDAETVSARRVIPSGEPAPPTRDEHALEHQAAALETTRDAALCRVVKFAPADADLEAEFRRSVSATASLRTPRVGQDYEEARVSLTRCRRCAVSRC